MSSPIADLSYRNYEGTLESPRMRWWVIAKQGMRLAFAKKSLYIAMVVSGWYYLVMMAVLFFVEQSTSSSPEGKLTSDAFMDRLIWKDQFLHGFSYAQLVLLLVNLLLGAGAIANDNRANALLVYLSKPCTKFDYMFGKWVGIFLPLLGVMAIPTLIFYLYGLLSFRTHGFVQDDPYLILRILAVLPLAAMLQSSLILGISSLFKQGWIAGATYAGFYFLGSFFTFAMAIAWFLSRGHAPAFVKSMYYCSIDGIQIGLCKAVFKTSGSGPFGFQRPNGPEPVPAPPLVPTILVILIITFLSLLLAWRRVRAVEVVG